MRMSRHENSVRTNEISRSAFTLPALRNMNFMFIDKCFHAIVSLSKHAQSLSHSWVFSPWNTFTNNEKTLHSSFVYSVFVVRWINMRCGRLAELFSVLGKKVLNEKTKKGFLINWKPELSDRIHFWLNNSLNRVKHSRKSDEARDPESKTFFSDFMCSDINGECKVLSFIACKFSFDHSS